MDTLLKLTNSTGYLFQERLRQEIEQPNGAHEWIVSAEEHRWCDDDGQEGFIDLVLENRHLRMVIEAKRTRDASWVFLVPKRSASRSTSRVRCLWTRRSEDEAPKVAWHNTSVTPDSPEAKFCIIRGQGDRDQPMLERLGGTLLRSTESLAEEELRIGKVSPYGYYDLLYFSVIVTNAQMRVCFYDPKAVDLTTGELPEGEFETVDFLRFRKGLSTRWPTTSEIRDLKHANREKERTLFVVNSAKLLEVLRVWDV